MSAMMRVQSYADFKAVFEAGPFDGGKATVFFFINPGDNRAILTLVGWDTGVMVFTNLGVLPPSFHDDFPKSVRLHDTNPDSSGPNQAYIAWTSVGAGQEV